MKFLTLKTEAVCLEQFTATRPDLFTCTSVLHRGRPCVPSLFAQHQGGSEGNPDDVYPKQVGRSALDSRSPGFHVNKEKQERQPIDRIRGER